MSKVVVAASLTAFGLVAFGLPAVAQESLAQESQAQESAAQDQGAVPSSSDAAAPSAEGPGQELPEVHVIQEEPKPQPSPPPVQVVAPKPMKKIAKAASPPPPPVQDSPDPVGPEDSAESVPLPQFANPVYGSPASTGAAVRAQQSAATPVNPAALTPANLEGFSNAATNLSAEELAARQPRNINEVFTRVPGIIVINDDAAGHHGGIAARGSPARRSRKMLVMEDGHPVNLALWLDPSVHYFGAAERFESVEVIRGTTITHGPNNNFGTINARNLSPFGASATVVSSSIGFTKNKTGSFLENDDDEFGLRFGTNDTDISAKWHTHTRQTSGNFGIVLSYTGENVQGTWDTERLRGNDFYGAAGWKGSDQDLTVSVTHVRQKDNYSEQNFTGEEDEDPPGQVEQNFFKLGHCQICYAPAAGVNEYEGDIWRSQVVHNFYVDDDTTITSRLYAGKHRRDRYQLLSTEADPRGDLGAMPVVEDDAIFFGEDSMFGRLRTFRHVGGEIRGEWANRPFIGNMAQTIQAGIRYEYQDMTNRNFIGVDGEVLGPGDKAGVTIFDRELSANAVSAFLQTTVKATSDFSVTPGVRLEWYQAKRINRVVAGEESEAEELEGPDAAECPPIAEFAEGCQVVERIIFDPAKKRESFSNVRALPGISFAYTGFDRTTVFGGYHRGMSTAVLRNEDFPSPDEIGDNFEIGMRSTAIRGIGFEVTGFHQRLHDFQFGSSFSDGADRTFGRADEAEINGVELLARLNSQPYTGGAYNVYGEANYTYAHATFKKGSKIDEDEDTGDEVVNDFSGNRLPEVPAHVAALTLGLQNTQGWRWDASVTWTYRGAFFTDEDNTPFGGDPEGENGEVPGVWLLSARFNMDIADTGASFYVSGDNLLDEFYISDREDGLKPGQGRTIWTGFKYKF